MINIAVNGLDDLASLVPAVQDLGRRHVRYGVTEQHYSVVGAALLLDGGVRVPHQAPCYRATFRPASI